jgi:hypothetical protein
MTTSLATYYRALRTPGSSTSSPAKQAGNYTNTLSTKVAKGVLAVLTLGIGYGILCLIERYGNRDPKVKEFTHNSRRIYQELMANGHEKQVKVKLTDGRVLMLTQIETRGFSGTGYAVQMELEGSNDICEEADLSFDAIMTNLRQDCENNPNLYADALASIQDNGWMASDFLADTVAQPDGYKGTPVVLEQIKNQLFLQPPPRDKTALRRMMYDAYENVTKKPVSKETWEMLDVYTVSGVRLTAVSPVQIANLLDDAIENSGLPGV